MIVVIAICWGMIGFAGGLSMGQDSYTWRGFLWRVVFGTVIGPFAFLFR